MRACCRRETAVKMHFETGNLDTDVSKGTIIGLFWWGISAAMFVSCAKIWEIWLHCYWSEKIELSFLQKDKQKISTTIGG